VLARPQVDFSAKPRRGSICLSIQLPEPNQISGKPRDIISSVPVHDRAPAETKKRSTAELSKNRFLFQRGGFSTTVAVNEILAATLRRSTAPFTAG
jgi:hypothetical protein